MKPDSTYNRKYYLIRKVKADGFELVKENNERKILIPDNRVNEAYCNPSISELSKLFQYGLQIVVTGTTSETNCKTVRVSFIHRLINKIKIINTAINIMRNLKEKQTNKQKKIMENKTNTVIERMLDRYNEGPVIMEEYDETPISDEKFEELKGIYTGYGKVKTKFRNKPIIFSGPQGSGKTYTCLGIANLFPADKVVFAHCKNILRNPNGLKDIELFVVEECQSLNDILSFDKIRQENPMCRFCFTTQAIINEEEIDATKFHLIACSFQSKKKTTK